MNSPLDDTTRLVITAAIAAVPPTLAALAALIAALRSNMRLASLHVQINSRMDQLLAVSASAARAEGAESQRVVDAEVKPRSD